MQNFIVKRNITIWRVVIVDIRLLFRGDEETIDHCSGVLECVLELNIVDNGFDQGSGQSKYYKIVIVVSLLGTRK
jgi:hypothetical protein